MFLLWNPLEFEGFYCICFASTQLSKYLTLTDIVKLASGDQHSMIFKEDGSVWSTAVNRRFIRVITGGVASADAGKSYNIVLMHDGSVWSTRKGSAGPIGDETIMAGEFAFFFVSKILGAKVIAAGAYHSLALMQNGRVRGAGWNKFGQLGDGSNIDKKRFVSVISRGAKAKMVAAGDLHSIVLRIDGSVWTTGRNHHGQLGDGSTADRKYYVKVMFSGAEDVAAGAYHSLVAQEDGSVWSTGGNDYGQLGDGSAADRTIYVKVVKGGAKAVAAGGRYSMMLKQDGSVWATGCNLSGQLGDGSTTNRNVFVEVISAGAKAVAAGTFHSLVLKEDGSVWATGSNQNGQFGDGSTLSHHVFVRLAPLFGNSTKLGAIVCTWTPVHETVKQYRIPHPVYLPVCAPGCLVPYGWLRFTIYNCNALDSWLSDSNEGIKH